MDNQKRIVITGVGVLAPNGIGKDAYWQSLFSGTSGIKPVTLFPMNDFQTRLAGEITDFDARFCLGDKGIRLLDRSTLLINAAAKFALEDAAFTVTEENTNDVGVVLGTTLGSLWSISEFDLQALREGPRFVNPALFPNTVMNSPASQISIRFVIKGFNTTIATGFTSALDALKYACDFIRLGRAKAILVGGVEALSYQTYLGFSKLGFLAGMQAGEVEVSCPFDRRRNGIILGEGAAMILIEDEESALSRGARVYGQIRSIGYCFEPYRLNKYHSSGRGVRKAMRAALEEAQLCPSDIDYISANANSTRAADKIEAEVIKDIFGHENRRIPVSSIKSMIGDTFSASGAMQLIAAVGSLQEQTIPPTINFEEADPLFELDCVPNVARRVEIRNLIVSCFSPSGVSNMTVIGRKDL